MPDIITGVRGTDAIVSTNVMPDIDRKLLMIGAYQYPLSSWLFLSKKKSSPVKSAYAKYEHFEKEPLPHLLQAQAAITASTTLTLTSSNVDNFDALNLGDWVHVEDNGEMGYVSSITGGGGSDKVITRDSGSFSSVVSGGYFRVIGNRNFEYGGRNTAKTVKEVNYYNYLNIFKYNINTSGRFQAGEFYTDGQSHDDLVNERLKEARGEIERYFWFAPSRGYASSGNERTTWGYGVEPRITTNVSPYTGALTEDVLRAHFKKCFRKTGTLGSNHKIHFAGEDQMEDIEKITADKIQLVQTPANTAVFKEMGAEVKSFRMFSGIASFVWNPIFDGKYTKYGFTIDEDTIFLRHMNNDKIGSRKFRMRDTTPSGYDGKETELLFDVGIDLYGEMMSGKLYGK
jgi:hypothetical protein